MSKYPIVGNLMSRLNYFIILHIFIQLHKTTIQYKQDLKTSMYAYTNHFLILLYFRFEEMKTEHGCYVQVPSIMSHTGLSHYNRTVLHVERAMMGVT